MTAEVQNQLGLTILLLDDNRVFAEVLAMRLSEQPEVKRVVVVATAQEALTWLNESHADLLLVDHQASGGDQTLEVMRGLSALADRPAVLVLSSESDHRAVMAAFESGVRGWATTDYSFATLWTAVREVASGHMVLSPPAVEPIVARLLDAIRAEKRAERRDFVVAMGGGVVGDLGGFVAATYLRGLPVVQVPTTLLAQVDSAIGGKTAVNLEAGKNLVGAWHMPRLVVVDPTLIGTLPRRQVVSGWAEPSLEEARVGDTYQFERLGYFCLDPDSESPITNHPSPSLIFNRTAILRDTWANIEKRMDT